MIKLPTAQIYIKVEDESVWEDYKQVCKANGWSVSERVIKFVKEDCAKHIHGGSQTLFDYAGNPKTLPKYKTCYYSRDKKLVKGEFYCNKEAFWVIPKKCDGCYFYRND